MLVERVRQSMSDQGKLNMFIKEKYGLVFYEVSPLPQSTMIEILQRQPL